MRYLGFARLGLVLALAGLGLSLLAPAYPCSTFVLQKGDILVFGKNFDWFTGLGMVVVNKRGVRKTAAFPPERNPASWVSKYGSITFDQMGREHPFGGMNEAGLVVEQMWLEATAYPEPDTRPVVGELQWIQYQLDNFSSVEEVMASDSHLRIRPGGAPLHYLVCDREGKAATIEFIEGRMVVHTGDGLPVGVLTNSTYAECLEYLGQHEGFGGDTGIPEAPSSEDRFVRAAAEVKDYCSHASDDGAGDLQDGVAEPDDGPTEPRDGIMDPVGCAFGILGSVAQGDATRWSIVYDIPGRRIHFRTLDGPDMKVVSLDHFDFECAGPVKILDVNSAESDTVERYFVDYTRAANRGLVRAAFRKYTEAGFFARMPDDATIDRMADYPETLPCSQQKEQ